MSAAIDQNRKRMQLAAANVGFAPDNVEEEKIEDYYNEDNFVSTNIAHQNRNRTENVARMSDDPAYNKAHGFERDEDEIDLTVTTQETHDNQAGYRNDLVLPVVHAIPVPAGSVFVDSSKLASPGKTDSYNVNSGLSADNGNTKPNNMIPDETTNTPKHSQMTIVCRITACVAVLIVVGIGAFVLANQLSPDHGPSPTASPTNSDPVSAPAALPIDTIDTVSPIASITPMSSPSFMTADPTNTQVTCFVSTPELRSTVVAYFEGDEAVKAKYGNPIGTWCVENIEDFSYLFCGNEFYCGFDFYNPFAEGFDEDISQWNTSSARNMYRMFHDARSFSGNLSYWDVSKVTNMNAMFINATSFDGDLSSWDVSGVTDMADMFFYATSFNGNLSSWNVSKVRDMNGMFSNALSFNQDLSRWDVGLVNDMSFMFETAEAFTSDLSSWDVSKVANTTGMFYGAESFNSDLSSWNVSQVTDMIGMFWGAYSFTGDLSTWDVAQVTRMRGMFYFATSFNSDISSWDVSKVIDLQYMFQGASDFRQNLCPWGTALPRYAYVGVFDENFTVDTSMFTESNCDTESNPDLTANPPGPFCFECV